MRSAITLPDRVTYNQRKILGFLNICPPILLLSSTSKNFYKPVSFLMSAFSVHFHVPIFLEHPHKITVALLARVSDVNLG